MAEEKGTPCDEFAKKNGSTDMTDLIAAIGTDYDEENQNLLDELLAYHAEHGKYPEYLAWWLLYEGKLPWGKDANILWITSVIKRGIPVQVAHKDAQAWKDGTKKGKVKMPISMGTWDEVQMLISAGYKWDPNEVFPTLSVPKKNITLESSAKDTDEDLVETIANLKVSGDDAEKVGDKDAEEEDSDKK